LKRNPEEAAGDNNYARRTDPEEAVEKKYDKVKFAKESNHNDFF
jgi:hypothetical protein